MSKFQTTSWMVICFFTITSTIGQEGPTASSAIGNQFNYILEKSESYKDLKIVKKQSIQSLKQDVLSAISKIESELNNSKMAFNEQSTQISDLKAKLKSTSEALAVYTNSGPTITFLGIQFNKGFFNGLLSFILLGSLLSVAFFAFRFRKMNFENKHSKSVLNDLEDEYQEYKRKAIEREQKISRQLQDELNKQKQFGSMKVS